MRSPFLSSFIAHLAILSGILSAVSAAAATWRSAALSREIDYQLLEPTTPAATASTPLPLIIYLEGLATPRAGREADDAIIADFRADGFLVAVFDYRGHPRARWPWLNRDLAALREQMLLNKEFPAGRKIDAAHTYIVPAGHRLKRDVVFARDGARTLAMDICYPSQPAQPVGTVLEFSCDNANRMGNFSLQFCSDTLLEGAATEGFAVAMADHPVPAPYRGLDAMPQCALRIKAAVRTLRAEGAALALDSRIVPVGFSRGSGMALMLVTTAGHPEFETLGAHREVSSDVQGAVVLSGRFTYLDLLADDKMIPTYTRVWGPRATRLDVWRKQGALDYLAAPTVPLFLSINVTESPDALHQMSVLRARLTQLGSPFEYHPENEPRGHHVPLAPEVLDPLLSYLRARLGGAANGPASSPEKSPAPPR